MHRDHAQAAFQFTGDRLDHLHATQPLPSRRRLMIKLANIAAATALTAFVAAAALAEPVKPKANSEKCYGVSLAGKHDCAAGQGNSCARQHNPDYPANT